MNKGENLNEMNKILESFSLPKIKDVDKTKQTLALILMHSKWSILILMFLLLMPYNTPITNANETKIIYPNFEIAILSNLFLFASFLAMWGWGKVLYQMSYRDVIKTIEKAETNRLFTSEVAETLIALVWRCKELRDEEQNKKNERTIQYYQKMLEKKGFDVSIDKLIERNSQLEKEMQQYKEIKEVLEKDVNVDE